VATEPADATPGLAGEWAAVLRHERIPFISYPYEWCFGMLRQAALLQLELIEAALAEGFSLKDATPYNVQWIGCRPVFIDVLSFYRPRPGEPWVGYRQFCELFLNPLLLEAYKGVPFQPWLRGSLEGIPPRDLLALFSVRDLLRRGVLAHVWLHARSQNRYDQATRDVKQELASAGFRKELILANVRGLAKLVGGLSPPERKSAWSGYGEDPGYAEVDRQEKEGFVRDAAAFQRWPLVWDLGANTGVYSRIAAAGSDYVIALEADPAAVETHLETRTSNVLPLVCNVADPSPGRGWRGRERKDLPERGKPDLMLCLALIHHLVIGANLRLAEVLDWLAGLGRFLVIEFVGREDPRVQGLLRHRDDPYEDYGLPVFEAELGTRFEVLRRQELPSGRRVLYFAKSRRR
jgi:SAM-dependent methyltransferase